MADDYTAVTVLFCEICGFSTISAQLPPATAVRILSQIYAVFDALVEYHNVHKVETVRCKRVQGAPAPSSLPPLTPALPRWERSTCALWVRRCGA